MTIITFNMSAITGTKFTLRTDGGHFDDTVLD